MEITVFDTVNVKNTKAHLITDPEDEFRIVIQRYDDQEPEVKDDPHYPNSFHIFPEGYNTPDRPRPKVNREAECGFCGADIDSFYYLNLSYIEVDSAYFRGNRTAKVCPTCNNQAEEIISEAIKEFSNFLTAHNL